jgi:hypothetical protein
MEGMMLENRQKKQTSLKAFHKELPGMFHNIDNEELLAQMAGGIELKKAGGKYQDFKKGPLVNGKFVVSIRAATAPVESTHLQTLKRVVQEARDYMTVGNFQATKAGLPDFAKFQMLMGQTNPHLSMAQYLYGADSGELMTTANAQMLEEMTAHQTPETAGGLPQGSPLSPYLSCAYLNFAWEEILSKWPEYKGIELVFYVDDGIFFSNDDELFERFLRAAPAIFKQYGLVFATEKCRVLKRGGVWWVPEFKYLGMLFQPVKGDIKSQTRKGNSLSFTFSPQQEFAAALSQVDVTNTSFAKRLAAAGYSGEETFIYMYVFFLNTLTRMFTLNAKLNFSMRNLPQLDSYSKNVLRRFQQLTEEQHASAVGWASPEQVQEAITKINNLESLIGPISGELKNLMAKMPAKKNSAVPTFLQGTFGGLILSRLYAGTSQIARMDTPSGAQDFHFRTKPGSLGQILATKGHGIVNLFNGSSYATGEMVRIAASIRSGLKAKVLKAGPLAPVKVIDWQDHVPKERPGSRSL